MGNEVRSAVEVTVPSIAFQDKGLASEANPKFSLVDLTASVHDSFVHGYEQARRWLSDQFRPKVFEPGQYERLSKTNPSLLKDIAEGVATIPFAIMGCSAQGVSEPVPPPKSQTDVATYNCVHAPLIVNTPADAGLVYGICYFAPEVAGTNTSTGTKFIVADIRQDPIGISEIPILALPSLQIGDKRARVVNIGDKIEQLDSDHFLTIYQAYEDEQDRLDSGLLLYNNKTGEYKNFPYPELDLSGFNLTNTQGEPVLKATPKAYGLNKDRWIYDRATGDIYIAASNFETIKTKDENGFTRDTDINARAFVLHYRLSLDAGKPLSEFANFAITDGMGSKNLALVGKNRSHVLILSGIGGSVTTGFTLDGQQTSYSESGNPSVHFNLYDRSLNPLRSAAVETGSAQHLSSLSMTLAATEDGGHAVAVHTEPGSGLRKSCVSTLDPALGENPILGTTCLSELRFTDDTDDRVYLGAPPTDVPAVPGPFQANDAFFDSDNNLRLIRAAFGTVYTLGASFGGVYNLIKSHNAFFNPTCGDKIEGETFYISDCDLGDKASVISKNGRLLGFMDTSMGEIR